MQAPDRSNLLSFTGAVLLAAITGCASTPAPGPLHAAGGLNASAWAARSHVAGAAADTGWEHKRFGDREPTRYQATEQAGRAAVHAHSPAGNSTLRLRTTLPAGQTAGTLRFSWFVPRLNEAADLRDNDIDDAVARVILSFEGDRAGRFTVRDHMLSELAQLITGEPLPYATLMYVWDNRYPVGTVIPNPHTRRIRQLVVESGPARLGRWVDIQRDVQADFRHAFGEAPGPLRALGVMSDANNTGATVDAWYGPLTLTAAPMAPEPVAATVQAEAPAADGATP